MDGLHLSLSLSQSFSSLSLSLSLSRTCFKTCTVKLKTLDCWLTVGFEVEMAFLALFIYLQMFFLRVHFYEYVSKMKFL